MDEYEERAALLKDHPELLQYPDASFPMRIAVKHASGVIPGLLRLDAERGDLTFESDKGAPANHPINQTGDIIETQDIPVESPSHKLKSGMLRSAYSMFGSDLCASAIELGHSPVRVSKIFAHTSIENLGVVAAAGPTLDGSNIKLRGVMRPKERPISD